MIKIHPLGDYIHRQPLAYGPIRKMLAGEISLVDTPQQADILLVAHSKDLLSQRALLTRSLVQRPQQKILLLSEEPFWDTIWADDPFSRQQQLTTEMGSLPFTFLNHHTSDIFNFDKIPYYLLTDHCFAPRYAVRFRKNATYSISHWQEHFAKAPLQAAFIAEKRLNTKFAVRFAPQDTYGLCRFRSQLTEIYQSNIVYRGGHGWRKGPPRQDLADWHLEKLLTLEGQCRFMSALENTHQPNYLSEKVFDAFAMGAVPLFYASRQHRLHQLVPDNSWVNLFGMTPQNASLAMDAFCFEGNFLADFQQAQHQLAEIFCTPATIVHERERLARTLLLALQGL